MAKQVKEKIRENAGKILDAYPHAFKFRMDQLESRGSSTQKASRAGS